MTLILCQLLCHTAKKLFQKIIYLLYVMTCIKKLQIKRRRICACKCTRADDFFRIYYGNYTKIMRIYRRTQLWWWSSMRALCVYVCRMRMTGAIKHLFCWWFKKWSVFTCKIMVYIHYIKQQETRQCSSPSRNRVHFFMKVFCAQLNCTALNLTENEIIFKGKIWL